MNDTQTAPSIELYKGITITVTPIINLNRQTGICYSFTCQGLKRQTFDLNAAKAMIDNILEVVPEPVTPNPLVAVTNAAQAARNNYAIRGRENLKSPKPFGED